MHLCFSFRSPFIHLFHVASKEKPYCFHDLWYAVSFEPFSYISKWNFIILARKLTSVLGPDLFLFIFPMVLEYDCQEPSALCQKNTTAWALWRHFQGSLHYVKLLVCRVGQGPKHPMPTYFLFFLSLFFFARAHVIHCPIKFSNSLNKLSSVRYVSWHPIINLFLLECLFACAE